MLVSMFPAGQRKGNYNSKTYSCFNYQLTATGFVNNFPFGLLC